MATRRPKRDARGRFARTAGSAARAAKATTRKATAQVRRAYLRGSFQRNLAVGQGGPYKGVKVGAEFRTPAGRGAVVKGIVGYHGKPTRHLDVTPKLDKPTQTLTVAVRPNPTRATPKRAAGSATMRTPSRSTAAGRKARR